MQTLWFVVLGLLIAAYAVLDGYDLGIGFLTPILGRSRAEQAMLRRTIEATWDGNEVFLVILGGVLFAVFPLVYASVLSGFYLVIMVMFFALVFRTVSLSLHYGGPEPSKLWRVAFWVGSTVPAFLFGVIAGNLVRGVEFAPGGDFAGGLGSLFNPFAIGVGVLSLTLLANQGATWAAAKTVGELHPKSVRMAKLTGLIVVVLFAVISAVSIPLLADHARTVTGRPLGWLSIAVTIGGIGAQQYFLRRGKDPAAFAGASAALAGMVGIWLIGSYPFLVPARGNAGAGLTIHNASSTRWTLILMTVILCVGIPLILGVLFYVNRIFRGRVHDRHPGEGY